MMTHPGVTPLVPCGRRPHFAADIGPLLRAIGSYSECLGHLMHQRLYLDIKEVRNPVPVLMIVFCVLLRSNTAVLLPCYRLSGGPVRGACMHLPAPG